MINLLAALNSKEIGQACAEFALRKHGYSQRSKVKLVFQYNADQGDLVAAVAFEGELMPIAATEEPAPPVSVEAPR